MDWGEGGQREATEKEMQGKLGPGNGVSGTDLRFRSWELMGLEQVTRGGILTLVTGLELENRRGKQNCGVRETPAGD